MPEVTEQPAKPPRTWRPMVLKSRLKLTVICASALVVTMAVLYVGRANTRSCVHICYRCGACHIRYSFWGIQVFTRVREWDLASIRREVGLSCSCESSMIAKTCCLREKDIALGQGLAAQGIRKFANRAQILEACQLLEQITLRGCREDDDRVGEDAFAFGVGARSAADGGKAAVDDFLEEWRNRLTTATPTMARSEVEEKGDKGKEQRK